MNPLVYKRIWKFPLSPQEYNRSNELVLSVDCDIGWGLNIVSGSVKMIRLDNTFQSIVDKECRLVPEKPVLVGVSGGPDSVCLLHSLQKFGYRVVAAHFDHQLRGRSSEEADIVRALAASIGVDFVSGRGDVGAFAAKTGASLEAAGRESRYRFLFEQAVEHQAQAVAVGHTADDQVETILMHFLRGAGLRGLRGMPFRRLVPQFHPEIPLVRPLLVFRREAIIAYREANSLATLEDPSNQDVSFLRNRVRHELLPVLESYNPRFKEGLLRMAEVLGGELEMVEAGLDSHWVEILDEAGETGYGIRRAAWGELPTGVRRGLLLRALRNFFLEGIEIDFETIRRALTFFSNPEHNGRILLKGGVQVVRRPAHLWVLKEGAPVPGESWPGVSQNSVQVLNANGEIALVGGWRISAQVISELPKWWGGTEHNEDEFQAWIDADRCPGPFAVRARLPGDRFRPLGLEGHTQKLSDVMIDEKIPVDARGAWPVVETQGEIIWLPGYRLSHTARLRSGTQRVIRLCLEREPE